MIIGQPQLSSRAQHPVGHDAPHAPSLDEEVPRKDRPDRRKGHDVPDREVPGAANNLDRLGAAGVDDDDAGSGRPSGSRRSRAPGKALHRQPFADRLHSLHHQASASRSAASAATSARSVGRVARGVSSRNHDSGTRTLPPPKISHGAFAHQGASNPWGAGARFAPPADLRTPRGTSRRSRSSSVDPQGRDASSPADRCRTRTRSRSTPPDRRRSPRTQPGAPSATPSSIHPTPEQVRQPSPPQITHDLSNSADGSVKGK